MIVLYTLTVLDKSLFWFATNLWRVVINKKVGGVSGIGNGGYESGVSVLVKEVIWTMNSWMNSGWTAATVYVK